MHGVEFVFFPSPVRHRLQAGQVVPADLPVILQHGFSSTAHGNEISEDDQWRKLERCVEVAAEVWGD
ncbi:MAG: hypothetical protein IMF08_13090 [Proteobacteria bacterium]|nr:hypothetical protein [Pseudomonadota bacterium]